ncbi:hypothetical protein ACNHE6_21230 [Enterobacter roggenkampii]|uniref:hypothetical protein n=1 Tax=Enterobacter roggenkampii TaxID=1812935 RepID=UPI003A8415B0
MSAGTITLTNGSAIVGGSGTSFETELAAGDFVVAIVGGITYTLPVKSVESPASLTLIRAFPGPTQSGAAWNAIPRATQNQLTAELVAQTTEALRGLNYDKQNWQAIFSDDGNITVRLPDGSTFSGPSWLKIVELLNSIDVDALQILAAQIHVDAQQVALDKTEVAQNKTASESAATTATQKADAAAQSEASAAQSKTDAAQSAQEAEADRIAIGDVEAALAAINGVATIPLGLPMYSPTRATIPTGGVAYDGQILPYATYTSVKSAMNSGSLPVVTNAQWLADPKLRQAFAEVDADHFRCPDYNGVQAGSIAQLVLAGGTDAQRGIFHGEAPNIRGAFRINLDGTTELNVPVTSGVFTASSTGTVATSGGLTGGTTSTKPIGVTLDASRASDVYKDTANDILGARAVGVIWGQLFGRINNPGSMDAATLAARIEQVNTRVTDSINKRFIRGLDLTVSTTTVTVSAGSAVIPSTGAPLEVSAPVTANIGATTASTWYHVYLYSNNGTPAIEISTTLPTPYAYPAHTKTGDTSRRYLGSFRVDASNGVRGVNTVEGRAFLQGSWYSVNRVLAGGTATPRTAVDVSSLNPVTAITCLLSANNGATAGVAAIGSTNEASGDMINIPINGKFTAEIPFRSYPNIFYQYLSAVSGGGLYLDIGGYTYAR